MATERALSIPEIVQCIVENTTDENFLSQHDIFNYLTLNHLWYAEAIRVLWRDIDLHCLWNVPWERRQLFANFVVRISVCSESESNYGTYVRDFYRGKSREERMRLMNNWNQILYFPKLNRVVLSLNMNDGVPIEAITQYFVPTLRKIYISGNVSAELLGEIARKCTSLDLDLVEMQFVDTESAAAEAFVRNCNTRELRIKDCFDSLIEVLEGKEGLEELYVSELSRTSLDRLAQPRQAHEHIFKGLTTFDCIDIIPIEKLMRIMPMLKDVRVEVPDLDKALKHLTRWPLLERVSLLAEKRNLPLMNVKDFAETHKSLKKLSLTMCHEYGAYLDRIDEMNDTWIRDITGLLPQLETLIIEIPSLITSQALITICIDCPFLTQISILTRSQEPLKNDAFSRHQNPVFKCLERLSPLEWVNGLCALQLEKHFPMLPKFWMI